MGTVEKTDQNGETKKDEPKSGAPGFDMSPKNIDRALRTLPKEEQEKARQILDGIKGLEPSLLDRIRWLLEDLLNPHPPAIDAGKGVRMSDKPKGRKSEEDLGTLEAPAETRGGKSTSQEK